MNRRQRLALALFIPLTAAAAALLGALLARPTPPLAPSGARLEFDGARALALGVELATDYPERVVGSDDARRARRWIAGQFEALELPMETMPFTVTVAGEARAGVNVYATSEGTALPDQIVLIAAHYDVGAPGTPGAADNASGVATLLELARVIAAEPHRRTVVFLASDSGAYGASWGAVNFAERYSGRDRIVAALDLDHVPSRGLSGIRLGTVGLYRGFTPLWLRRAAAGSVESVGLRVEDPGPLTEYRHRALPIPFADSGAYLAAGIPAVSLAGVSASPEAAAEPQTHADTPDKLTEAAFAGYGRAAERLARTLDGLLAVPSPSAADVPVLPEQHLSVEAVSLLQLVAFAPLFLALVFAWRNNPPDADYVRPEIVGVYGWLIAMLDGYAVAYALALLGVLPRYERYPATANDPFLVQPNYLAALLIAGTVAAFAWYIFRPRGFGGVADRIVLPHRRVTLLMLLAALALFALFLNGFGASWLLLLPAYLWIWIEPRAGIAGKAGNAILALAGALPFVALVAHFAALSSTGPAWWFLILGAAYGLFPPLAVIPTLLGGALLIRFLRLGLSSPSA